MEVKALKVECGPDRMVWTQVGMRKGPVWHEGGVRWVGLRTVIKDGRPLQVGHVRRHKPEFAAGG